jgi:hypothetical protein
LALSGDIFGYDVDNGRGATIVYYIEARYDTQYFIMGRSAHIAKSDPVPNVNSTKSEKPCYK